jgi:WD40 repeat protein
MFALQCLSSILFILFGASHVKRIIGGFAPSCRLPYPEGDVCLDARKHLLQNGALTIMLCRGLVGGHMGHRKARRFTDWILLRFNCIPQIQLISRRAGSNPTFHPNGGLLVSRPNQGPENHADENLEYGDLFEWFKSLLDASPIFRYASLGLNTPIQKMVMHPSGKSFFMGCYDTEGKYSLISYRFDQNHSSVCHTILHGHLDSVNAIAVSPEGNIMVSACSRSLYIWRVSENSAIQSVPIARIHCKYTVLCLAIHPSGKNPILAHSGLCNDVTLCQLDESLTTTARVIKLSGHTSYVHGVIFLSDDSDGIKIASASADKTIRLWSTNFESVTCCMILNVHKEIVRTISIHPNRRIMVSASMDGTTIVWWLSDDNSSATPIQILQGQIGITNVVFDPSGRNLLVSSTENIQVLQ